jgi:hypothetical protein
MSVKRLLPAVSVFGFYLLMAMLITWPLVAQLGTHLAGWSYGDSHEMLRHIWWYNHALRTGQPVFWQPALGYPDGMEGVLLWAHPQQFFPAWLLAFVLPLPAAANLSILLYMALNGWAMHTLAFRLLDGRRGPALLAGLAYMAAPAFQGHLGAGHAGLMVAWPVPLYVLALLHLNQWPVGARGSVLQTVRSRWFWLAVLFFVLSPGGHILQLIYVLLPISGVFALAYLRRRNWRALLNLVMVNGIGCALLLMFVLPIARSTFETTAYVEEGGFVRYSADLLSAVSPSFFNPLYSWLDYPRRVLGTNLDEGTSYVGIIAGLLAITGGIAARRARFWVLLALAAWFLSLGPLLKVFDAPVQVQPDGYASYVTLPFAALQNLPFFNLARTPARFNFALALAVAMLAGYGAAWLWERLRQTRLRPAMIAVLMGALLVDYQVYWPLPTHSAAIPGAVYELAGREDVRAVLNLPWDNPVASKDALYLQTAHHKPLIAGHVTRSTPVSPAKLTLLEQTLDPALLDSTGADIVILHKAYLPETQIAFTRDRLGDPLYEDTLIALFEAPPAGAAPAFAALTIPDGAVTRNADSYLYAPQTGWADFSGTLQADADGREVELLLDQQVIHRWRVDGPLDFNVPLPIRADSYHVARLALNPPCPAADHPALECRSVMMSDLQLREYAPASTDEIQLGSGIKLRPQFFDMQARAGDRLSIRLLWSFEQARSENDVRFVHLVGADGLPIVQDDRTLGAQPAGSQWAENVTLTLPDDLPRGAYRLFTGWYTYPDLSRIPVLSSTEGAEEGLVLLGFIEVA